MKPGVNGGAPLKAMNGSKGLKECVLNNILGVRLIAAKREGGTQQPISIRVNQFLRGREVLAFKGRDKLFLIHAVLCH
jgi:hypothetical protein